MYQFGVTKSIVKCESSAFDNYLQSISKVELISQEEEVELVKRIKDYDQEALDKLVKSNLSCVLLEAFKYENRGLSLPDLINAGNSGLFKAALRFDETCGFKFINYAVWWIRESMLRASGVEPNDVERILKTEIEEIEKSIK